MNRHMIGGLAMAGTAVGMIAATPAGAQAQADKTLEFDASGLMLYDNNVGRSNDAAAVARGIKQSDMKFTPSASAKLNLPLANHHLSAEALVSYDIYRHNDQLNRERLKFSADADIRLPICEVELRGSFSRRQSELEDLSIIPGDPRGSTRNVETIKGAGATVTCGGAFGFSTLALVDWSDARNDIDVRKISDNHMVTYRAGILYKHPAVGEILFFAGRRDVEYPNRTPAVTTALNEYTAKQYGVTFRREIGVGLQLSGEIMQTDVDMGGGRPAFNGLNWSGQATLNLFSRLQLTGGTARTIEPSLGIDANYVEGRSHYLTARLAISDRLTAIVGGTIGIRDYAYSGVADDIRIEHDNRKRISAGLDFAKSSAMTLGIEGAYQKRDANGAFYDYDGFQASLRVGYRF